MTVFVHGRHDVPETLVASALVHATRRGVGTICVVLGCSIGADVLRRLLSDPRIASVVTKEHPSEGLLPDDLRNNPRVGRYCGTDALAMPPWATDVYFVDRWHLITADMLRGAARRDMSLRVRFGTFWAPVPLGAIRAGHRRVRRGLSLARFVLSLAQRAQWAARRCAARLVIGVRPGAAELAVRIAGPARWEGVPLQHAFEHVVHAATPMADAVPGRVVHVCGSLQPGGAERQLVYTLQGLSRSPLEGLHLLCHFLTRGSAYRYDFHLPAVQRIGVDVREIRRRSSDRAIMPEHLRGIARVLPPGLAVDISDLYWEFIDLRPQIVHAWLDWDNVRAGLAAVLAGVPKIILSGRNINPSHFALYQPYMDPAYAALAQAPNVTLINNSRAGADDYADWIGIPRDRIGVVHNAVDFGDLTRLTSDAASTQRTALGIPADAFVVGGMFRLDEEKRPILWVETAMMVARALPNARFVIFGQGRMHTEVQRKANQLGLGDRLILAGLTTDVRSAMSVMDVLLLTSSGEGLPNVLLEAQWFGTPVVATDVGGVREAVDPGATGWTVATHRTEDLAERLLWLHGRPQTRAAVLTRGPLFVREKFAINRMISDVTGVYGLSSRPADAEPLDDGFQDVPQAPYSIARRLRLA